MTDSSLKSSDNQSSRGTGRLTTTRINSLLKKADQLRRRHDFDQAISTLNQAESLYSNYEAIFLMRAEIYRQTGEDELALADFNQAINVDPANAGLYLLRGELYRLLKQPHEALADLDRALQLKPNDPQTLGERGMLYRNTGQYSLALADNNRALEIDPQNSWLLGNRAETYRHLGEYRKALTDYNEILTVSPDQSWVYERRSYAFLRLGYLDKALQDFEQTQAIYPDNVLAGWMAEWVKMCKKTYSFGSDDRDTLQMLAGIVPESYEASLCRSMLAWLEGDYLPAYQEADIPSRLEPERPEAFFWKGLAAAGLNKMEEAFQCIQKALDLKMPPILLGPANILRERKPDFYEIFEARFLRKTGPLTMPGFLPEMGGTFTNNDTWAVPNSYRSLIQPIKIEEVSETLETEVEPAGGLVEETEEIPYLKVLPEETAEQLTGVEAKIQELPDDETVETPEEITASEGAVQATIPADFAEEPVQPAEELTQPIEGPIEAAQEVIQPVEEAKAENFEAAEAKQPEIYEAGLATQTEAPELSTAEGVEEAPVANTEEAATEQPDPGVVTIDSTGETEPGKAEVPSFNIAEFATPVEDLKLEPTFEAGEVEPAVAEPESAAYEPENQTSTTLEHFEKPGAEGTAQFVDGAELAPYTQPSPDDGVDAATQIPAKEDKIVSTSTENEGGEEVNPTLGNDATQPFKLGDLRRDGQEAQRLETFNLENKAAEPEEEFTPFTLPGAKTEPDQEFEPYTLPGLKQSGENDKPAISSKNEISPVVGGREAVTQPFKLWKERTEPDFEIAPYSLPKAVLPDEEDSEPEVAIQKEEPKPAFESAKPEDGQKTDGAAFEAPSPVAETTRAELAGDQTTVQFETGAVRPEKQPIPKEDEKTLPAIIIPAVEVAPYTRSTQATLPFLDTPTAEAPTVQVKLPEAARPAQVAQNGVNKTAEPTGPFASSNRASVPPVPPKAPTASGGFKIPNFAIIGILIAVVVVAVVAFLLLAPKGQGTPTPNGAILATSTPQSQVANVQPTFTPVQATAVATVVLGGQTSPVATIAPAKTAAVTTAPAVAPTTAAAPTATVAASTTVAPTVAATTAAPTATAGPTTAAPTPIATLTVAPSPTTAPSTVLTAASLEKFTNQSLGGHTSSVYSVVFSPDGKTLYSGSNDKSIKIWQINGANSPNTAAATLNGHQGPIYSVALSPDGKLLASGSADQTVKIWQINGTSYPTNPLFTLTGHEGGVNLVAFSPDGKMVASASEDKTVKLWDVTTGKLIKTLEGHTFLVNSVAFSPDGKTVASGGNDTTVRLWDVASGETKFVLSGHNTFVNSVAFSPNGKVVASASSDRTIKLWDTATGKEITTISGHPTGVTFVTFSPDGKTLASGGTDNTIKIWDVSNPTGGVTAIGNLQSGTVGIFSLALSPDGKTLADADRSANIKLWDFGTNLFDRK